jgi:hypothetical protein
MNATDYAPIFGNEEVLDSRDIIGRIAELEERAEAAAETNPLLADPDAALDEDEEGELAYLKAFAAEAEDNVSDWQYGETFINDDYFTEYAEQLASDIGAISEDATWPLSFIDWEAAANALKSDYTSFDFNGVTYWARA